MLPCERVKGRKSNNKRSSLRAPGFGHKTPYGLALSCLQIQNLQGDIAKTLEALYRHLQGTSYHHSLLQVSMIKDSSLDYHNILKYQEKYSYGKVTDIKSVVADLEQAGIGFEKEGLLRIVKNCQKKISFFIKKIHNILGLVPLIENL